METANDKSPNGLWTKIAKESEENQKEIGEELRPTKARLGMKQTVYIERETKRGLSQKCKKSGERSREKKSGEDEEEEKEKEDEQAIA